jgi:pyruvate dehydrogenase E2 component (dihydrolipoamide acetyltransferase)
MIDITMPRLSDTMEEGTIARWHKKTGDAVNVGDILVEIETDKATMDYQAYEAGTLAEILVLEGGVAAIGTPIARLDNVHEDSDSEVMALEPAPPTIDSTISQLESLDDADRHIASPLVRRLAREHTLDLRMVRGSGPGGRIIRADLDELLAAAATEAEFPKGPTMPLTSGPLLDARRGSEQIPFTNVRRVIARRLGESARTVPHFYATAVADAEDLVLLRRDLNEQLLATGRAKVSVNDLLIRACALALRERPLVNASYTNDTSASMLVHHRINIGVAVATKNGLVVPVINDADQKSVSQIGAEAKQLATQAGTKGLSLEQMSGGTFTISNLGMYGIKEFTAIINPPEGAILAVGATTREPVGVDESIVLRHRLHYTMSADHRIIDGALAAQFLQTLTHLIEHPLSLIV